MANLMFKSILEICVLRVAVHSNFGLAVIGDVISPVEFSAAFADTAL
jgi:hypothetical protein